MATIAVMQRYADKVADKLGLEEGSRPALRWFALPCTGMRSNYAHSHLTNEPGLPRGTICLARGRTEKDGGSWRRLITHEVTHLRVKDHNSVAFLKWMTKLGQGSPQEKRKLIRVAALRHRHEWGIFSNLGHVYRQCRLCRAEQEATPLRWIARSKSERKV